MVRRHTGTGHNQVLCRGVDVRIGSKSECAADFAQLQHDVTKLLRRAIVHCGHASAARGTETRRRDAGSRESHDQHAFAFEFNSWTHRYLSFNVVNENSAKTRATIQKRTMIFDSLQPANSK